MNNLIKRSSVLFGAIALIFVAQSCKKPTKLPDDPCANPIMVTALDPSLYTQGHFSMNDNNLGMYWLYANNWSQFAGRVEPGKQYGIGYIEAPCKDGWCGTNSGIAVGGCFIPQRKCIIIKCLKEIKGPRGCFESVVDPPSFNDERSDAISTSGINGNSLSVKIGFSGCNGDQSKDFKLYMNPYFNRCGTGPQNMNDVFIAKAVNTYKGYTCMAYFERNVCFDLSAVRNFYLAKNMPVPDEVTIRVMTVDNSTTDYTFKP